MQLVMQQQQSEEWCWQVRRPGWRGAFDIYSYKRDVFVQIDDKYHFYNDCKNDAFVRDLACNKYALASKIKLVRVHYADLVKPDITMAAIEYATDNVGVVFSASYKPCGIAHVQQLRPFVRAAAVTRLDAFGNELVA